MKKYLFSIIPFILGLSCLVAVNIIGSEIAPDGRLVEPFGLIPIGMLLTVIGLTIGIVISTWNLFNNPKKTDKGIFALMLTFIILAFLHLTISFSYLNYITEKELFFNDNNNIINQ